ncbi:MULTISPECIES: acetyltransferase [Proteus]|uniref:acetyltransferase n=1 Tax=Proteus TaxID=583 RepID=UPI0013772335|nr:MULTISPECIES: acetyltransferase [Proteus]MDC9736576.1 acetyltransferase [Proteus mirabilis]MDC9775783.1 acetyltransferase [Proteus mirabilis]MDC9782909.1 acetyltransferase [Proteus mirabilis]NBN51906.1 acetyltransferase [Proteus sp. G4380]
MLKIRISRPSEAPEIIQIWKNSVDATHDFLTADDRQEIEKEVIGFFSETPVWVATNQEDRPLGFMFLHDDHLEALFIDASARGLGIGKQLISHALALHPNLSVDVNEQNQQAVGFYQHMGFQISGRSELDNQGRAYPLLHLSRAKTITL